MSLEIISLKEKYIGIFQDALGARLLRTDKSELPQNLYGISENYWNSFLQQVDNIEDPLFVDYVIEA